MLTLADLKAIRRSEMPVRKLAARYTNGDTAKIYRIRRGMKPRVMSRLAKEAAFTAAVLAACEVTPDEPRAVWLTTQRLKKALASFETNGWRLK